MSKVVSLLLLTSLAVNCAPVQSPLRLRINSDLIKSVINKNDEQFFEVLKDISLGDYNVQDGVVLKDLKVSINP